MRCGLFKIRKLYRALSFVFVFVCIGHADDSWMVYDDTTMATIQIEISTEALEYIYDNVESDSMHVASVNFSNYWLLLRMVRWIDILQVVSGHSQL